MQLPGYQQQQQQKTSPKGLNYLMSKWCVITLGLLLGKAVGQKSHAGPVTDKLVSGCKRHIYNHRIAPERSEAAHTQTTRDNNHWLF